MITVHVNLVTSGTAGGKLDLLLNTSTSLPFRYREPEKHIKIRVFPQGPFYITFSETKSISIGTITMEFNKKNVKYRVKGDPNSMKTVDASFFFEDFNSFTVIVGNSEIQFIQLDSEKVHSFSGDFSRLMFVRFSSYSHVEWIVQEGKAELFLFSIILFPASDYWKF